MHKLTLILMILLLMTIGTQAQEQGQDLAFEIIALINEWRISEDVAPLRPNETLAALAFDQASFLASLPNLPSDFHEGRRGLHPRERAQVDPFRWPHYELSSQVAITENAAVGSVRSAMNFWKNSALHTRAALNPAYREIGVAAVPYGDQHVFIVVFGSRPNVLPALVDPRTEQTIFLTNEQFPYAAGFNSIQTVTTVRVFDSDGRPVFEESLRWSETITIPEDVGDMVFLLLTDGEHEVLSQVNLVADRVILPGYLPSREDAIVVDSQTAAPTEVEPTAEPTTEETTTQESIATLEVTPEPTTIPTAPPADEPEILIVYSRDTLSLINVSGEAADWTDLELAGTITFPFTQFARVADFPLDALPNDHCLQIRPVTISGDIVLPEGCRWLRSLVTIQPDRVFWAQDAFDVRRSGVTMATCTQGAGICEVDF